MPDPVRARHRGAAMPVSPQCAGRDRHKQEMIQESALGVVEIQGEVALLARGGVR